MKKYEFLVGATENRYGPTIVEADTLEEAKQKFFAGQLHHHTELKDGGEFEHYRIVNVCEIDENGDAVADGESEDQIDIPGEKSEFRRGRESALGDLRDAEKRLQGLSRQLRDMQSEVYKAKLVGHVARGLLTKALNNHGIAHLHPEFREGLDLIRGRTTDHDALRIMVSVSMVHMDPKTNDFLLTTPTDRWPVYGASVDGGYIIHCEEDENPDIPRDLWHVLQWARNIHGACYVKFDSDGFEHDGLLPTFNWD